MTPYEHRIARPMAIREPGDLGYGAPGAFDDEMRCYAGVIRHGEEYRMWYTGNGPGMTGMGYATSIAYDDCLYEN